MEDLQISTWGSIQNKTSSSCLLTTKSLSTTYVTFIKKLKSITTGLLFLNFFNKNLARLKTEELSFSIFISSKVQLLYLNIELLNVKEARLKRLMLLGLMRSDHLQSWKFIWKRFITTERQQQKNNTRRSCKLVVQSQTSRWSAISSPSAWRSKPRLKQKKNQSTTPLQSSKPSPPQSSAAPSGPQTTAQWAHSAQSSTWCLRAVFLK